MKFFTCLLTSAVVLSVTATPANPAIYEPDLAIDPNTNSPIVPTPVFVSTPVVQRLSEHKTAPETLTYVASYYGKSFHGRRTANGERFDMYAMTAAHKTLPFGTRLRVTNEQTGNSVEVRINDRGPFIAGRDLDLSQGAAQKLGLIRRGHAAVAVQILS